LTACLDALEAGQDQSLTAVFISNLAIALATAGQVDEADTAIDRAMAALGEPTHSHFHLPEMMRIKGEILASRLQSCEAETWFSRSIDLAREQSALAWELRAATSFAHCGLARVAVVRHGASCGRYMIALPKDSILPI